MEFNHNNILDHYDNVVKHDKTDGLAGIKYVFSNEHGSDYLEMYVLNFDGNERELRFIHDNFPMQRRSFSTNIPLRNIEDFEAMFERMKIPLPIKKQTT